MTRVGLQAIALAAGDTAPHSMSELYNFQFTDGTYSPASGRIRLNNFRNKTVGGTKTFSYTGLTDFIGTASQGGTWRSHVFTTWTLPNGFNSNSPNFSFTVNIDGELSGDYLRPGQHYGSVGMLGTGTTNSAAQVTHDTSSGIIQNGQPEGIDLNTYDWTRTKSTLNDTAYTLIGGDTVDLKINQYVDYWKTLDIEFIITW